MSVRIVLSLALAVGLAACGGNPTKPAPAPAAPEGKRITGVKLTPGVIDIAKKEGEVKLTKDDRVKCEKYKPLGSNRTQYRCTTKEEARKSEDDNQRDMRKMQTPPPSDGARSIGINGG